MKKLRYLALFVATFLIGSFAVCLMFKQSAPIAQNIDKTEPLKVENIATDFPPEKTSQPRIFKVEGIEKEFEHQENKHFIEPGEVSNGEDFKIKSSETWLGLFGKNEDSVLRQTKVKLRNFREDDLNWTNITVKEKESPLFLVRNLKKVKAGKVTTLFRGVSSSESDENNRTTEIGKGFFKQFKLGEQIYTLRVEQGFSEEKEPVAVLLFETGNESQIIDFVYNDGDWTNLGNLYWVGDFDGDGKLDLYKDFWNYEKGYYLSGLFLSSEAKKGKLVKRFEFLAYGGC